MIEIELKCVVDDLDTLRKTLVRREGKLVFEGELEDRRYDTPERSLRIRDEVLRLRIYRDAGGARTHLEWKGPSSEVSGYKRREEIGAGVDDAASVSAILTRLGYEVTMSIDRHVWQYEIAGATVRLERYPRMDDLVEVEGSVDSIERAIERLELPRAGFSCERLPEFVRRYEQRTGGKAALSAGELSGVLTQDAADA